MERNKSRRGQVMREREARKEKEGKSGKKNKKKNVWAQNQEMQGKMETEN